MEREAVFKLVGMLVAAYPNWKPTKETIRLYATFLEPLPFAAVDQAINGIIRSDREFCPPVGAIIQSATVLALDNANRPVVDAEEAWLRVENAIRSVGSYGSPFFSPAINRAVEAIGWKNICRDQNIAATRAHFFRLFERFQESEIRSAADLLSSGQMLPEHTAPAQVELVRTLPVRSMSFGERTRGAEDGIEHGRQLFRDFMKGVKSNEAA